MYRINLYPEYHLARRDQRRRARQTAVVTALLGVELLLVGALVLSDATLRQRIGAVSAELPGLQVSLAQNDDPCPGFTTAQRLAELLESRVVWAPKLAALADRGGRRLEFTSVSGRLEGNGRGALLTIAGACKDDGGLTEVRQFVAALRSDARVGQDLPEVALGNLEGERETEFEVRCRRRGGEQP